MNNHFYGDLSNLNAPYDQVPLQGLGQVDDPKYPWLQVSQDTLALQQDLNEGLTAQGLCALAEDGKMGPKTCGAIQYFVQNGVLPSTISTCSNHGQATPPGPCGSGGGGGGGGSSPAPGAPESELVHAGGGLPGWAIGLGIGALAIGIALVMSKKKRR